MSATGTATPHEPLGAREPRPLRAASTAVWNRSQALASVTGALDRSAASAGRPRSQAVPAWFDWPLVVGLLLVAGLIAILVPAARVPGALLAYLNVVVIGGAWVYFASRGTLQGLMPVMFLTWLAAGWPLGSLYFALVEPDYAYATVAGSREFLYGGVRLQSVTLLFAVLYIGVVWLFQGRAIPWRTPAGQQAMERRVATVVLWIAMSAITFNAISKVTHFPGLLQYVADGGYHTLHGLPLVVGVLFTGLAWRTRLTAIGFLLVAGTFYVIGNARGMAGVPIALVLVGLIFLSNLDRRWKKWMVVGALVAFPLAMVISNTTRLVTKTIGFTDLNARVGALNEWQDVLSQTPVLTSTFGRLFLVGGHTVVTMSPEHYPYVDFDPARYTYEFVMRMLPKRFFGELYYSEQPNRILRLYGFLINDETSHPLSTVGALYMLGGLVPVVVGAVAIGLFHSAIGFGLRRAQRRSPYMALFVFAMISSELLWGFNRDPISHIRSLVWDGMWGLSIYYLVVRPLVGDVIPRRRMRAPRPLALRAT